MKPLSDRLARGEESAFVELVDACADRLHGFLLSRLGSRELAAEALQATLLRAVKSRRRFAKVENPQAYVFQIARNEATRLGTKTTWWRKQHTQVKLSELVDQTPDHSQEAELAAIALEQLTADDRELVELKIFAGLTFREIAEVTDQPQGTVATKYRRALESLRPWLTKQYQDHKTGEKT